MNIRIRVRHAVASAVTGLLAVGVVLGTMPAAHAAAPHAAGDAAYLTLRPGTQRVPAGYDQPLTARAYDRDGNLLGDVTSATTFSILAVEGGDSSSAHCNGNSCTVHDPGRYVIVGSYSNPDRTFASGTAKMHAIAPIVVTMDDNLGFSTSLYDGTQFQAHDTAYYSNGDQKDVTSHGGWSVENTDVATVTPGGRITAVGPGSTRIDFGVGGFSAYADLFVYQRHVSITSVSPGGGYVNDQITIRGTNLDTVQTARFGSTWAFIAEQRAGRISVMVPSGATSGPITLNTGHGFVSAPFTVYPLS